MTAEAVLTQVLNGLTIGAVLMLIAMGLTIIFGLMDVVNFAHGALYMLGAYLAVTTVGDTGHFWLALLVAPLGVGVLGSLLEYMMIRPLYGRDPLLQVLLTFGVAVVLREAVEIIWGPRVQSLDAAGRAVGVRRYIRHPLSFLPPCRAFHRLRYRRRRLDRAEANKYRVDCPRRQHMTATWWMRLGLTCAAFLRECSSPELCSPRWRVCLIGPLRSVHPDMGNEVIVDAFIAVIVGGLGSVPGAVAGALLVGMAELMGALAIPGMAKAVVYVAVAIVMIWRPSGLLGGEPAAGGSR